MSSGIIKTFKTRNIQPLWLQGMDSTEKTVERTGKSLAGKIGYPGIFVKRYFSYTTLAGLEFKLYYEGRVELGPKISSCF